MNGLRVQNGKHLLAASGKADLESFVLEIGGQKLLDELVVLNDKQVRIHWTPLGSSQGHPVKTWRSHREQQPTQRIVTLINMALTALSRGIDTADESGDHGILDRPKGDGNRPIPTSSYTEGHGEMRDRRSDRLLHMDDNEDIRSVIKIAFEPIGGLVVGSCVSSASASPKVPVFNRYLMLIDVISSIDGIARVRDTGGTV